MGRRPSKKKRNSKKHTSSFFNDLPDEPLDIINNFCGDVITLQINEKIIPFLSITKYNKLTRETLLKSLLNIIFINIFNTFTDDFKISIKPKFRIGLHYFIDEIIDSERSEYKRNGFFITATFKNDKIVITTINNILATHLPSIEIRHRNVMLTINKDGLISQKDRYPPGNCLEETLDRVLNIFNKTDNNTWNVLLFPFGDKYYVELYKYKITVKNNVIKDQVKKILSLLSK